MKECTVCKQNKEETDFFRTLTGIEGQCKACRFKRKYQNRIEDRLNRGLPIRSIGLTQSRELKEQGLKYCYSCKRVLELQVFSTTKVRGKIASVCKECANDYARKRYQIPKNKEKRHKNYEEFKRKRRDEKLKKSFNICLKEYEIVLEKQNFRCKICGITPKKNGKALAVDHDHFTRKIRGLLCNNCNVCVGFLQNNPMIAYKIAEYLQEK